MAIVERLELVNISLRLYAVHRDLIDRAAALDPDRTLSDYCRDVLVMQAALDLNEEIPAVPEIKRGRGGSLINQAAAKLGMSREEFESRAALAFAAQTLGADAIDNRPATTPPPSGRKPSGTYAVRGETVPPKRLTGK